MEVKYLAKAKTKKCITCSTDVANKPLSEFYNSKSPQHIDGKVPWCKDCIKDKSTDENGKLDRGKFQNVLRQIDKPYFIDILEECEENLANKFPELNKEELAQRGSEIVGAYFRNIQFQKCSKDKLYGDSVRLGFYAKPRKQTIVSELQTQDAKNEYEAEINPNNEQFIITDEMTELFGDGYSNYEYKKMWKKYNSLKQGYNIQTSMHKEALATYVRFKVKEEIATSNGDVENAKKWYAAATDAADKAKLSPKQLTKADLTKGLNSFSEISLALEQAVDIIPVLPQFKEQPNDMPDFIIWCYINYARKLKGVPCVDYSEVYRFYDDMAKEYIDMYGDPYGIFNDSSYDRIKNARENQVRRFITLPKDYESEDESSGDE